MTEKLLELLQKAINEVNKHPKGELILPIRKDIYRNLGEHKEDESERALFTSGLLRRTKLAVLCVMHVIDIWNGVLSKDNTPSILLESINDYISGKMNWEYLWDLQNEFWTVLDNYLSESNYGYAIYVGHASINATVVVLHDENLEDEFDDKGNEILDEDLDPFTWDTSFYAAAAYSENELYDEKIKIQKRREFWMWYLNEAVPLAYQEVKD